MLSRLILLTAGNEPKLAELFARAELKRTDCAYRRRFACLGRLGDVRRKPQAARRHLTGAPAKLLVFKQLFALRRIMSGTVAGLTL